MTMRKDKNKDFKDDPEFAVDSRYRSKKERESEAILLMETRLKKMKKLTGDQITRAKLMQLKLKMDEYLNQLENNKQNNFSDLLKFYIDAIYTKRSRFAEDINITAVKLSQVINNHREPNDEFLRKLMIHSENAYKGICDFKGINWYLINFNDKLGAMMASEEKWRPKLEKEIKLSEKLQEF
jgi:hypothetical protein